MKKFLAVAAAFFMLAMVFSCREKADNSMQYRTRFIMDTYCTIHIPGNTDVLEFIDRAFERMEEVEKKFSAFDSQGQIYRFNNENIPISDTEIVELVKTALEISEKCGGAFDITVFPLIDYWGFSEGKTEVPDRDKITQYLHIMGSDKLSIENGKLVKSDERTQIDLGGIAKGYALGEAAKTLKNAGIESALINAGGDIYALGSNRGKPWKIGIRNPRGDGIVGVLELVDCSVATSGDYERFFIKDDKRYHHIIDPKTGYPAEGVASVTVISRDPVMADALSTALFVMGKEKSIELQAGNPIFEMFMITENGKKIHSPQMQVQTIN